MDPTPAPIVIELDAGTAPSAGRVRIEARTARPFTGWTGLFAVLRAVAGEDTAGGANTAGQSTSRKETER